MDTAPLRKILELEARKGYNDSAVMGGLDRFLSNWVAQKAGTVDDHGIIARFKKPTPDYNSLSQEQRRAWVTNMLDFLVKGPVQEGKEPKSSQVVVAPKAKPAAPVARTNRSAGVQKSKTPASAEALDSPITVIKGINTSLAGRFRRLGLKTVRDLLYFFPNRHIDYSQRKSIAQLAEGKEETIVANVWQAQVMNLGTRRSTEAIVGDETGNIRVIWFNNPYVARSLKTNGRVVISGRVALFRGQHVFESPEWEVEEGESVHTGRLVPIYHLTQGLGPRQTRRVMKSVVDTWSGRVPDFIPTQTRSRQKLLDLPTAIAQAHFPDDAVLKDRARVRLAFDELFLLQIGVQAKKRAWQESQPGSALAADHAVLDRFLKALPFELTGAQDRCLKEILADLSGSKPMSRLLQGDVGSGKTVVATAALLMTAANGYQGAFMAPTEILAEQHVNTITGLLSRAGRLVGIEKYLRTYEGILPHLLTVALLTGDIDASSRRELHKCIAAGGVDIVIGTHAIIQKDVGFNKLGMAVVDEQHRFGVSQRSALRQKGTSPHILVMTATPIPRTLALTLYGDLDISVIDQLPAGRQIVKTKWLKPDQRGSAYAFVRKHVKQGRQAFIICPLVEESDAIQAKAAVAEYERLSRDVFPDLHLALLHGRMAAKDKDEVMHQFHAGEMDVLVATPVVEVGIDVPNATVMLVESADRFGLSQLHQFRGRVGRGREQSYCLLLAEAPSEIGEQRLDIIEKVYDGFRLAEEDLRLRGPGEFFGTRQSGLPDLRMAKLSDVGLLEIARSEAALLFKQDPRLKKPEHSLLAKELARVWPESAEWS